MRFEKTTGDLMIVNGVSPRDIGLYEVFNVMLDVLLDVRSETGQELYSLNVDEQAVAKWIAVANALLSVPVESGSTNMTRRRAERLTQLQNELKQKAESVSQSEKEIDMLLREEEEMEQKLTEYRKRHAELSSLSEKKQDMQEEIKRLEADIEAMDKIDYDTISERRNQLRQTKADKEKRLQAYNDYNEQLDMLLGELEQTNASIAGVSKQIAEAEKQNSEAKDELRDKLLVIQQKQQEQKQEAEKLNAEIENQIGRAHV